MPVGLKSHEGSRTALILYGSETGNAQDIAEELGRLLERLHFVTRVCDMNSVDSSNLSHNTVALFAISTTGQGDIPANAQLFWKSLLRRRLPPDHLQGVKFATFGLGDSSYPKFNWAVRKLHKRLAQLGAREIYSRGEADEQHPEGSDGSYLPWSIELRAHLLHRYPLPENLSPIPDDVLLQPKWTLEFVDGSDSESLEPNGTHSEDQTTNGSAPILSKSQGPDPSSAVVAPPSDLLPTPGSLRATLTENIRVTPTSHWQDVRHLTFTTESLTHYLPGDVLTIFPKNFPDDVDQFLRLMEWDLQADRPIRFVPTKASTTPQTYPPPPIPHLLPYPQLTLRSLLTSYLDITSIPRRSFFSLIAHFTNDAMHKERLLEFTNPEYIDELYDYTTRPRRSILEVLQEFESVKIPWQWVGTVLPVLRGRQFSIASGGPLKTPVNGTSQQTRIELLVAIVKYRTVIKKIRQGVCTRYLAALPTGTQMNVRLQRGGLGISKAEATRPAVMIGPGTGVAPMRSLIWERLAWSEQVKLQQEKALVANNGAESVERNVSIGENVLFFGCRNKDSDYFFADEWEALHERLGLKVFTAFSRDQKHKLYVQDLVREQSRLVYRLLHGEEGVVYICGSSGKMPQAVREALIEVFQKEGMLDRASAEGYLMNMEKGGRYKQETW
ncbi:MAG: NAPDH-dependent diflavin reductase [Candelina submexicana]|nr:MAG: NAPDH-dependent diflavin reductase [Candelina submexicana]